MIYKTQDQLRFGADITLLEEIPVGIWLLLQDELTKEFYLERQPNFTLPDKIYGNEKAIALRYLETFRKVSKNTGVLLTGQKGNGKSLTAKIVCQSSTLPVILITQPFVGEVFQSFLGSMKQEVIIFIDEFEKVYSEDKQQEEFLPILDGVFESKKLFLFTSNSMRINDFLKNRPGRIRYLRKYRGLTPDVIDEIIEDKLEDKTKKEALIQLVHVLSNISMDVLLHLIEELNFYGETPLEAVRTMNIQVEHTEFDVMMYIDGKRRTSKIYYNPLTVKRIYLSYREKDERDMERWRYYEGDTDQMKVEAVNGDFIFSDKKGNEFTFTASKPFEFNL